MLPKPSSWLLASLIASITAASGSQAHAQAKPQSLVKQVQVQAKQSQANSQAQAKQSQANSQAQAKQPQANSQLQASPQPRTKSPAETNSQAQPIAHRAPTSAQAEIKAPPIKAQTWVMTYSAKQPDKYWSVPVQGADGKIAYRLSLMPEIDPKNNVVILDMVLHHPNKPKDAENLLTILNWKTKWHTFEKWTFAAPDFAHGIEKSSFGSERPYPIPRLPFTLEIIVQKARVTKLSEEDYKWDYLQATVHMDNRSSKHPLPLKW